MASVITWSVLRLECIPQEGALADVVLNVHWQCVGVDSTAVGRVYDMCVLPAPSQSFTPYGDLTEAQVLEWIWGHGVNKTAQEAIVDAQIADVLNPPIIAPPLPWAAV